MEINERVAVLETDNKTIFRKLDYIESKVNDIHELATAVSVLGNSMREVNKKVDDIGERIGVIEKAPAESANHYKKTAVSSIISAVLGAIAAAVLALILK